MRRYDDSRDDSTVYFRSDRIFYQGGFDEVRGAGWYIAMRGGYSYGPFPDKDVAQTIAEGLIQRLAARAARQLDGETQRNIA